MFTVMFFPLMSLLTVNIWLALVNFHFNYICLYDHSLLVLLMALKLYFNIFVVVFGLHCNILLLALLILCSHCSLVTVKCQITVHCLKKAILLFIKHLRYPHYNATDESTKV